MKPDELEAELQKPIHQRIDELVTLNKSRGYELGKDYYIIINPKITKKSDKKLLYPEMCMSAAPIIAPTKRAAWIEFDYYDESGLLQSWSMKADTELGKMLNRVFQHEIDHMDGIINIDKCNPKDLILESDPKFYENAKFTKV